MSYYNHYSLTGVPLERWEQGCITVQLAPLHPPGTWLASCACCSHADGCWHSRPRCTSPCELHVHNTISEQAALQALLVIRDQHIQEHHKT